MKILQIVQKPQRRGAEIFAFQLTQKLLEKGNEVKIVYLYPAPAGPSLALRNGDTIIGVNEKHFFEVIPGWNPAIVKKLRKIIAEFHPDVVQVNAARTVKYGSILRRMDADGNWVLIYRNIGDPSVWQKGKWKRWFYKNILISKIDGIVAVSEKSLGILKSFYQREERIIRIPRAVDLTFLQSSASREEIRSKLCTPNSSKVLLYIGSLTTEKRIDRLLRIANRLVAENVHVWIIGSGSRMNQWKAQAGANVHFVGATEDVASYISAADLFVLSSDTEGIPGALLEAAALSVPAVATRVGGLNDCVKNGETGILVDPQNEEEFESAIRLLLKDDVARKRMGQKAKEFVLQNFSLDQATNAYIEFYKQVLKFRRSA